MTCDRQYLLGSNLLCGPNTALPVEGPSLLGVEQFSLPSLPALPIGFTLHEDVISDDLVACIRKTLHLEKLIATDAVDLITVEDVQTSIEARLVFEKQVRKEFGPISECCRVAVFIVSYMLNSAIWKSKFLPFRLAEKLLQYLEETSTTDIWRYRRDLFLWLLLIGASTAKGQNCFATDLTSRYQNFIERTIQDVESWTELRNGPKALGNVLKRFIYPQKWIEKRHLIPGWMGLEKAVFSCGSEDVNIEMDTDAVLQDLVTDANLFE